MGTRSIAFCSLTKAWLEEFYEIKFECSCVVGKIELGGEARNFLEKISSLAEFELDCRFFISSLIGGVSFSLDSC